LKLKIYVQPNASRSELIGLHGDALKIKIKALPVDGAANEEIIRFLSKHLDLPKKSIRILHGESSRNKLVEIDTEASLESGLKKKLGL